MSIPLPLSHSLFGILFLLSFQAPADLPSNNDSQLLREKITVSGIRAHQSALQEIAEHNNGNRMASTSGYTSSVAYVKSQLEKSGFTVSLQEFSITLSKDNSLPVLIKTQPEEQTFVADVDFASMTAMGSSEKDAEIEAVDLKIPSQFPNHSTSGCEKEDFANFKRGNIALIQRGHCTFLQKIDNAIAAGAAGAIIFNEGNAGRTNFITSRIATTRVDFPILGASFFVGESLRNAQLNGPTGIHVLMKVDVVVDTHLVQNVIAETNSGDKNRVLVVGAHLDGVHNGPGINDNGSGSATILELATAYSSLGLVPKNRLRFVWFAAEEFGLLGSEYYVNSLSLDERTKILAMLNFDMLGSSNYARFVYDGDNSAQTEVMAASGPDGSGQIEKIFLDYFSALGLASHPTAFNGRSDYGPFIEIGIPAGGLFSGAEGIKSAQLAEIYGGIRGAPFDPCYHQSCDDFLHTGGNKNSALALKSLDELSDAAAHALFTLGNSIDPIKSRPSIKKRLVEFEYRGSMLIK